MYLRFFTRISVNALLEMPPIKVFPTRCIFFKSNPLKVPLLKLAIALDDTVSRFRMEINDVKKKLVVSSHLKHVSVVPQRMRHPPRQFSALL